MSLMMERGHVGLRIVQQIYESESINNIVVRSYGLRSLTKTPINNPSSMIKTNNNLIIDHSTTNNNNVDGNDSCFLNSCHLCHKTFLPIQDVYMYRGDLGFCSIECRNKQIMMDERKEMEAKYKKKKMKTTMIMEECRGCDTCKLLQDLRRQRHRHHPTKSKYQPSSLLSIS